MSTAPAVTMREALADPSLLGGALHGPSWDAWRALLIATMGEELTSEEREVFEEVTGRSDPPPSRVEEALYLIGRRGGKDRAASVLATYLAALVDWTGVLAPGERGLVLCIGPDQRQARITRDYIEAVFEGSPVLAGMVTNRTADAIELDHRINVEVRAANYRRLRGVTCVACIATEAAYWYDDASANADEQILAAVRPALSTTGGPLVVITTPHARRGEVWKLYDRHYGPDGDPLILVAQAPSRRFNPTLPQRVVDRAYERDPHAAGAEFGAEFRADVSALLTEQAIQAVVPSGVTELPPDPNRRAFAHYDAATGSGKDAAALGIAFAPTKTRPAELALVRQWRPPFSPSSVIAEASSILKQYGLSEVQIDRMAINLIAESFREHSVTASLFELDTSASFVGLLTVVNSRRCILLDHPALLTELRRLERRSTSGGRDRVGHAPGAHDDVAASASGAIMQAVRQRDTSLVWGTPGRHFRQDIPRRRDRRWWGELLAGREQTLGAGTRGRPPDRIAGGPSTGPADDPFSRENRFK